MTTTDQETPVTDTDTTEPTDQDDAPAPGSPAAIRDSMAGVREAAGIPEQPDELDGPDEQPEPDRSASRGRTRAASSAKRDRKRKRSSSSSSSGSSSSRKSSKLDQRDAGLRDGLTTALSMIGMGVSTFEPFDGAVILAKAEETAEALDRIAQTSPAVARALNVFAKGGAHGTPIALALAVAPIAVPILHHHGLLPEHPLVDSMASELVPPEAKLAEQFAQGGVPPEAQE